jgi:hypothetical protein
MQSLCLHNNERDKAMNSYFANTAQNENNVKNILMQALVLAEADLIDAHKDVERYEVAIKHHTTLIKQLRNALSALGYDTKESK